MSMVHVGLLREYMDYGTYALQMGKQERLSRARHIGLPAVGPGSFFSEGKVAKSCCCHCDCCYCLHAKTENFSVSEQVKHLFWCE